MEQETDRWRQPRKDALGSNSGDNLAISPSIHSSQEIIR